MNILKKSLAPITDKAWNEITEQAGKVFSMHMTARNAVDIDGPNGLDYGGLSTGRLIIPENQSKEKINYGIRQVLPLIEVRKPFILDIWELDSINRGARDADLDTLVEAAKEMADFENKAICYGLKVAGIKGLAESAVNPQASLPEKPDQLVQTVAGQVNIMKKNAVEGPYSLLIQDELWKNIASISTGYPIPKQLKELLDVNVVLNHSIKDSFLLSQREGDYELVLGQDVSIGYDGHDNEAVKLYFTETFTFRVMTPEAVIMLKNE